MARKKTKAGATSTVMDERVEMVQKLLGSDIHSDSYQKMLRRRKTNYEYLKGNHAQKEKAKRIGNKVYNKYAEIVHNRISYLTGNRPKFMFRPQGKFSLWLADALNQVIGDVIYDMSQWESRSEKSVLESCMAGSNHIRVNSIAGYPDIEQIPAFAVVPDGTAKDWEGLSRLTHLFFMPVELVKEIYNVDLKPELLEDVTKRVSPDLLSVQQSFQSAGDYKMPMEIHKDMKGTTQKLTDEIFGKAMVVAMWMDDHQREAIPFEEKETKEEHEDFKQFRSVAPQSGEHHIKHVKAHEDFVAKLKVGVHDEIIKIVSEHILAHKKFSTYDAVDRRKFPYGRVITISQGKLLDDSPNPLAPLNWKWNGSGGVWHKYDYWTTDEYWGKGLGDDLIDPQDDLNHRKNMIAQNVNLLNNGVRKVAYSTWKRLKDNLGKLNNLIGKWIPMVNKGDVEVDFGKPFPPQIFQDLIWTEQFMDKLSHHAPVMAGQSPGAGTAGVTVDKLLAAGSMVLNNPIIHYGVCMANVGFSVALLMQDRFPEEEVFDIIDAENNPKEVQWGVFRQSFELIKQVRVDYTSMLPTTRMQKLQEALMLKAQGVYDNQAVLELIDDPKAPEVLQRTSELLYMQSLLQQVGGENENLKKQLNTMTNRLQKYEMQGNVGAYDTGE